MPSPSFDDFLGDLQAALDAANSNLGIAQNQVKELQAEVDWLTKAVQSFNGFLINSGISKEPPPLGQ